MGTRMEIREMEEERQALCDFSIIDRGGVVPGGRRRIRRARSKYSKVCGMQG